MMKMGAEFWAAHVAASQRELIPVSEYARQHGLAVKSLYYWWCKLKKSDSTDAPQPAGKLVALPIAPSGFRPASRILALPSDLRLDLSALPQPEWPTVLVHAILGIR